jgi:hypothetical protein
MFKEIVENCFSDLKRDDPSYAKHVFGYIWAVFASKRVRYNNGTVWLTWRELSAELAIIYSEWFDCRFTTDAFLNVVNCEKQVGDDPVYDEVLMQVYRHADCVGIFRVKSGPGIRSRDTAGVFSEIDVVTGEEHFYKQGYEKGNCVGSPSRISANEYEKLCYGH